MDCGQHIEFGSDAYVAAVFREARKRRQPVAGSFDLTYRCNLRCSHCFVGHLTATSCSRAEELRTEEIIGLLSDAAGAGCLLLLLSGGEPLLREDFCIIYVAAKRLGLITTVFTNATLIRQEHVELFQEYPPHKVEVSLYGASETTYERIAGAPGSFRRARRGIDRLLDAGVRVGLKTMILRDNVEEVSAIEEFAESLGVSFRLDPVVTPRLNGGLEPLFQRVDPGLAVDLEFAAERRRTEFTTFFRRHREAGGKSEDADRLFRCGAGIAGFHVDPWGYMKPCLMATEYAYSIATLGFAGAWKAVTAAVDGARWPEAGRCGNCPDISVCGYCPGLFALEQASSAEPPEYLCRLGERRRLAIDRDVLEVACVEAE